MSGKQVIESDQYDLRAFERYLAPEAGDGLRGTVDEGRNALATFGELAQDIFSGLYKFRPQMVGEDELAPEYRPNRGILERAMDSATWERLRLRTRGQTDLSAFATVAIGKEVLRNLPDEVRKEVNDAVRALQEAREVLEGGGEAGPEVDVAALVAAVQEAFDQNASQVQVAVRDAVEQAMGEVQEFEAMASTWGSEPGSLSKVPWRERLALSQRVRDSIKLRVLSELLGRFRRIALAKVRERAHDVTSELVGLEMGRDLGRVVPSSLANYGDPVRRVLFLKEYMEGTLLQYKVEGKVSKGRGPIVVCLDESGSMAGPKEMWAKAVALALASVAHREKRAWHCIHFGYPNELAEHSIERNASEEDFLRTSIAVAEHFFGGGTDFMAPLNLALEKIKTEEDLQKADVVFITDGQAVVTNEFLEVWRLEKSRLGFNCVGVQVGNEPHGELTKFTDNILPSMPGAGVGDVEANAVFKLVA